MLDVIGILAILIHFFIEEKEKLFLKKRETINKVSLIDFDCY
jgi:hypothetical protein